MKNRTTRVTIKDVAHAAGVSIATVSQALKPRAESNIKLPEDTVDRVKTVAESLKYRPHTGARSIRARTFMNVGFFSAKSGIFTHSPDGYLAGVHDAANEKGYSITLIRLPQNISDIQGSLPSVFTESKLDALIIGSYHEISSAIRRYFEDEKLPIVYLNDRHQTNAVYVDDVDGAATMTTHLIESGYRKIVFLLRRHVRGQQISEMHHSARDRYEGYRNAMHQYGLTPILEEVYTDNVIGEGSELPEDLWERLKSSDCVFAYDDDLANNFGSLLYSKRLKIPDHIGLAGYNGDYASMCAWQTLTTMRIPSYEMGQAAFELALELVQSPHREELPSRTFSPILIKGNTTN